MHNSRLSAHRAPFGAVETGTDIRLYIHVPAAEITARLRLWIEGHETLLAGQREGGGFTFHFRAPDAPGLFWYFFVLEAPEGTRCYGGTSGEGALYAHSEPPAWQVSVYAPYETPAWFREGLCYQIFPDRFARSGERGEPRRGGLDRAAYHTRLGRRVALHESWDEEVNYRPYAGEKDYDPCDFFGGDLKGIEEQLPYLKTLGVSCIYLNPVFESPSNHRYNTADYENVDPILGGNEALVSLARAAAAQGMRLMLDGVFSHTGDDSVYFNKYGRYPGVGAYQSQSSPYAPWYDFVTFPQNYKSWWGFKTLPELKENEPSYREFVKRLLTRWAELGITSWRLDVADELPDDFLMFLRRELKALDPDAMLLGEVWEDASNKTAYGALRAYTYGAELDGVMGYPFRAALLDFMLYRTDAQGFADRLMLLREHYPKPFYEAQLNILGSHDTVRILTALSDAPGRDELTREAQANYAPDARSLARGRARLLLCAMTQMALPGVPGIYYGDEAGLTGMADPFCRRPYPWGKEDGELLRAYRALARARRGSAALTRGGCAWRAYGEDVFAALRVADEDSALLLINRSESGKGVRVALSDFAEGPDAGSLRLGARYMDVLTEAEVETAQGVLQYTLAPLSGALLREMR